MPQTVSTTPSNWSIPNSVNHATWTYLAPDQDVAQNIGDQNHVSRSLAECLARLGLTPGEEVAHFLNTNWTHCFDPQSGFMHDPFLMKDMQKAVDRLKRALQSGERIRVVTDYDVDGTTSSLILQATLNLVGHAELTYHIPDRRVEGYGLTTIAVQKAIDDQISLIVTADIGVRDVVSIRLAKQHNIDVIVFDHHLPKGGEVPEDAYAVVCPPQKGCPYPNKSLAACGISFKLAQAMLKDHPKRDLILRSMTKLAALGTVADVVSLRELENRAIVASGLSALNNDHLSPGLEALIRVSEIGADEIKSDTIGYRIGPRINAAGRLSQATLIIELMQAKNSVQAMNLALKLDALNTMRKDIQENMVRTALDEAQNIDAPFLFIVNDEDTMWNSGVNGIVAGRIRETLHRPTAIATRTGQTITGSIRSTPGVHAVQALESVSPFLIKYGGHAAAAGFSLDAQYLDQVKAGLSRSVIEQLGKPYETPNFDVHLMADPADDLMALFDALESLEPCGTANTQPVICFKNVRMQNLRILKDIHFTADLVCPNNDMRLVWWNAPDELIQKAAAYKNNELTQSHFDLIGTLKKDSWRGVERLTLQLLDMRTSEG